MSTCDHRQYDSLLISVWCADVYHCPVTFKVFNENSNIVAIRPTGNVFSYEVHVCSLLLDIDMFTFYCQCILNHLFLHRQWRDLT